MKIDTTAIEGYAEMSAEEKIAALEAFEYEDHSDEANRYKDLMSKANSQAAASKKQAKTDADALAEMREQLSALQRANTISEYKAKYLSQGYDEALAASTAEALADGKMDVVFENSQTFMTSFQQQAAANAMKNTPRPQGQQGNAGSGVDYTALISEAQAKGDYAAAGYYMRLSQSESAE